MTAVDLVSLVAQCTPAIAPATMLRIVQVESGGRAHAIGYHVTRDGKAYRLAVQPKDRAQAEAWATRLLAEGYRFDAGIAQVNSMHFARFGLHPGNVFDACRNLQAGGAILQEFYARSARQLGDGQAALSAAVSSYQTGSPTRGFQTGYVGRVMGPTSGQRTGASALPSGKGSTGPMIEPKDAPTHVLFATSGRAEIE